jgi:putative ABC transport system permease protein
VDGNFFEVFSFPIIKGNKSSALDETHAVVISRDMEKKYFGGRDAVGRILQLKIKDEFENFTVTAVAENLPQNSTLTGDIFLPYSYYQKYNRNTGWMGGSLTTFLLTGGKTYARPASRDKCR